MLVSVVFKAIVMRKHLSTVHVILTDDQLYQLRTNQALVAEKIPRHTVMNIFIMIIIVRIRIRHLNIELLCVEVSMVKLIIWKHIQETVEIHFFLSFIQL